MKNFLHSSSVTLASILIGNLLILSCSNENDVLPSDDKSASKTAMSFSTVPEVIAPKNPLQSNVFPETRTSYVPETKEVYWQAGDQMSVYDGYDNNQFSLIDGEGSTSATFSGTAAVSSTYYAVYPYQVSSTCENGLVSNVVLPTQQVAVAGGFDPAAALMMAKSSDSSIEFKNAVGYVKVTPTFDCQSIRISVADTDETKLSGTGSLNYNDGKPFMDFAASADAQSYVQLNAPKDGVIAGGNSYMIAVPAGTLQQLWRISFTVNNGKTEEFVRVGTKQIEFKRNTIVNLGSFDTNASYWYDAGRGYKVNSKQEVDLGVTVQINGDTYKVLFAKGNLTSDGITSAETDFGDYFAWGATEPWYTSYTYSSSTGIAVDSWKTGKNKGYQWDYAPYKHATKINCYTKYTSTDNLKQLEKQDDAASVILGGDWMIPSINVWQALKEADNSSVKWSTNYETVNGVKGIKVSCIANTDQFIFLPAAGWFNGTTCHNSISTSYSSLYMFYWSSTLYNEANACYLRKDASSLTLDNNHLRGYGFMVRPVRLVKVESGS